jgi:hypothetical protein
MLQLQWPATTRQGGCITLVLDHKTQKALKSVVYGPSGAPPTEDEMQAIFRKAREATKDPEVIRANIYLSPLDKKGPKIAEYEAEVLQDYTRPPWRAGPGLWG